MASPKGVEKRAYTGNFCSDKRNFILKFGSVYLILVILENLKILSASSLAPSKGGQTLGTFVQINAITNNTVGATFTLISTNIDLNVIEFISSSEL